LKVSAIRKSLKNLPKTLDDTYARILTNIEEDYQQEALSALLWLVFSERPLKIEEIADAAVVNPQSDPPFNPDERLSDPNDVLQILAGLVTISPKDGPYNSPQLVVRLAHFSVKEYLLSDRILNGPAWKFSTSSITANDFIARSCLLYILHYDESDSKAMSSDDLERFPLLQYACQFWYIHAKSIPVQSRKSIDPVSCRLFLSNTAFLAWLQVHRPNFPHERPFSSRANICLPLYYASDIGLEAVVQQLLEHHADVDAKDSNGATALYWAATNGHEAVVRLLLEHHADIDAKDGDGATALYRAAGNGHETVVRLLEVKRE
jgi:hypothetical protein